MADLLDRQAEAASDVTIAEIASADIVTGGTVETDVRRGLPSASGIERIALCPGSLSMEKGLADESSAIAEEGTLLHEVMAGTKPYAMLDADQQDMIDRTIETESKLLRWVLEDLNLPGDRDWTLHREIRLWYKDAEGNDLYSGQLDRVYVSSDNEIAIVIELKYGYIPVDHVDTNIQLRSQAVLVAKNWAIPNVCVAVIQPRCRATARYLDDVCLYKPEHLIAAERDILAIIEAAKAEDAKRSPSEVACKYCKAKAICPEAQAVVTSLVPERSVDLQKKVELLPNDQLGRLLEVCANAEDVIEAARKEAKTRLEKDATCIPGWQLKENSAQRKITSPTMAFKAIEKDDRGEKLISPTEFMAACSVPVGQLELLYGLKTGLKGKILKERFNEKMGDVITLAPKAPSLARRA